MIRCLAIILLLSGVVAPEAQARPQHKQALAQFFGPFLPKKLDDCVTCHVPTPAGQKAEDGDKPHNALGQRLAAVKKELSKAGKKTTIEDRLTALLSEDSDGDGFANLIEILSGRFPGDKNDLPTAAEQAEVAKVRLAFERFRAGHPWRPFEVVRRPAIPQVKNAGWVRNPIDAFVAAEQEALGLTPRPEAPRAIMLRRLYIDLIGLPPTPQELQAFLNDPSPQAYDKVVEELLSSPRHGERWGRHWMDVWRYSDWAGFGPQIRDSQPHIWRWRDWIIEALNTDKGYDRMILEMLAGDELAPEDDKALAATGYLVRNYKLLSREKWLQDTVEHTFLAFQGITIGCAKCHDHMYDPILQTDYYQVRAVFEPHNVRIDRLPGQPDPAKNGLVRAFDKDLTTPTFLFIRGDDRTPDKSKPMAPGVPEALGGRFGKVEALPLPPGAVSPDKRAFVIKELLLASKTAMDKARADLDKATASNKEILQANLELAVSKDEATRQVLAAEQLEDAGKVKTEEWQQAAKLAQQTQRQVAVHEARKKLLETQLTFAKAGPEDAKKKAALAQAQQVLDKAEGVLKQPAGTTFVKRTVVAYPAQSTGRRLALARWLADRDNPLTARVAVNHIWLRHFGQAIVPSVFDFGRNGRAPTHPALLDWLAAEFMEPAANGTGSPAKAWSMKHVHRLIVTSAAYRQASTPDAKSFALDRDNKHLWRFPPRRVEAEVVRDSLFHVAGKLDLAMSGPDIDYPLGMTVPRRSLYFRHAAEKQMEFLQLFDAAAVTECYERRPSIVPQQALALFNSELSLKSSRILARTLHGQAKEDGPFVAAAFAAVLSRAPTEEEKAECLTFLGDRAEALRSGKLTGPTGLSADGALPAPEPALRARENLVHVLLNHHDFVTIR